MSLPALQTDGDKALESLYDHIVEHCILPSNDHAVVVALWVAHTHFISQVDSTPRLSLQSPDKQSGKTRLLEVISPALHSPLKVVNLTSAVLFRAIEEWQPTFVIDEADAFFPKSLRGMDQTKEDIRAMLNAGHRRGQGVMRMGGAARDEIRHFNVFTPAVMAGIADLPDTIEDRAIIIHMRRRRADEEISPYRMNTGDPIGAAIGAKLQLWASHTLLPVDVPLPLEDRPADVWEPLFRVAAAAGGYWPEFLSRAVHTVLEGARIPDDDERVMLIRDIRTLQEQEADTGPRAGIHAGMLVNRLNQIQDSPWPSSNYGRGINAYDVRVMLKSYGIQPQQIKLAGINARGYRWTDFDDAFARYLSPADEHTQGTGHKWSELLALVEAAAQDTDTATEPNTP